jgi:chaperonin GroES
MPRTYEVYSPGTRVFLMDGPPTPGTILPQPEGVDPQFKVVKLDGEELLVLREDDVMGVVETGASKLKKAA